MSNIEVGTTTLSGGADKRVLFQDGSVVGEDAGLEYDKATGDLAVGGDVDAGGDLNAAANVSAFKDLKFTNPTGATASHNISPTTPAATNQDGDSVFLDSQLGNGTGAPGQVNVGATAAQAVNLGRAGKAVNAAGILALAQGLRLPVRNNAAAVDTITTADVVIIEDFSGGNIVANLPQISTCPGQVYCFSVTLSSSGSGNILAITPHAGDTIYTGVVLNMDDTTGLFSVWIVADGATNNWVVIGASNPAIIP